MVKILGKKLSYSSVKKDDSKKYEEKRNEILTNRLMFVFVLAIILITSLIIIVNGNFFPGIYYIDVARFLAVAIAVCAAASLVYFIVAKTKGKDESEKTLSSTFLLATSLFSLFVYGLFAYRGIYATNIVISAIIAATIIYFTYYLYSKEFFLLTLATAVACYCVYFCQGRLAFNAVSMLAKVCLVIVPAAIFVYFFILGKPAGFLKLFAPENKKSNKIPFVILIGLSVASAGMLFVTTGFTYYNILAILAYYLIMGIIYTIKLI